MAVGALPVSLDRLLATRRRLVPMLGDALRLAAGTLSAIPVRPPSAVDRPRAGLAMLLAPVAVLPIVVAAGAAYAGLLAIGVPAFAAAAIGVGLLAWLSRGMHWDGLADSADGLAASFDRDRALRVMSTGDVGPAGALTIVVAVLTQVGCLAALAVAGESWRAGVAFAIVGLASRAALSVACRRGVPAAKPDGLGATVAGSVSFTGAALVWIGAAAAMCGAAALVGQPWWQGLVAATVAALVLLGWLWQVRRRLGGINGDVLGASIEITMTALLVALVSG